MRVGTLLLLFAVVVVAVWSANVWAAEEKGSLEGTWKLVSWEEDGKALSEADVKKSGMTIKGDKFTLTLPEGTTEGSFKTDATKKPHEIDVASVRGRFEGKTALGICELSDDTYKACFAPPGKDRPREFSSRKGSGTILFVFKREKARP